MDADSRLEVTLTPVPAAPPPRQVERPKFSRPAKKATPAQPKAKTPGPDLKKGDVVDPFAQ